MVITDTLDQLDACHHRVTLVPAGEIDAGTVDDFADSVWSAVRSGAHEVDVDLSDVPFMDTAALRVLEIARESLASTGGHLCLRNPKPPVRRLLSLTAFTAY